MSPRRGSSADGGKSAVDRAVEGITERLNAGVYVPGQRLIEPELMSELNVGRNAVREALARLGSEGLVRLEPHRGASVRRIDARELSEFFVVREALEGMAARCAALRIDEGTNREVMTKSLADVRDAVESGDPARYMDQNLHFHATIVELAGNDSLSEFVSRLRLQLFRIQFQANVGMMLNSHPEHEGIAEAILEGDGPRAEARMRRHVRRRRKETSKVIEESQVSTGR
jgi:DNA-binding GntR family transcriptional regulator